MPVKSQRKSDGDSEKVSKKRKKVEDSDSTQEPVEEPVKKKSKKKEAVEPLPEETSDNLVKTFAFKEFPQISKASIKKLAGKGITGLFEIQATTFKPIFDRKDVVGQAKTGCGKTLAFTLPILERIKEKPNKGLARVVCVAPTRELARQIFEFQNFVGSAHGLSCAVLHGGVAFYPQVQAVKQCDFIACTPGRMLDHIKHDYNPINLSGIQVVCLDEADEMLSMGFQEDVEAILNACKEQAGNVQILLFSATMPAWINQVIDKFLVDPVKISLVDPNENNATNNNITHLCISCPPYSRTPAMVDLVKVYSGKFGRTVIFVDTKREANELTQDEEIVKMGAAALHGDIPQETRESTLESFRQGKVKVLLATDVAARGLDIPNVDLVINIRPPLDHESYVHRSGRTARAGKKGTSLIFFGHKEASNIRMLARKLNISIRRVGVPQPLDLIKASTADSLKLLELPHQDMVDAYLPCAKELIEERGAEVALACALAALGGNGAKKMVRRSLLSCFENYVCLMVKTSEYMEMKYKCLHILRRFIRADLMPQLKGVVLCADKYSFLVDVPEKEVASLLKLKLDKGMTIQEISGVLPELDEEADAAADEANWREAKAYRWNKNAGNKNSFKKASWGGKGAW